MDKPKTVDGHDYDFWHSELNRELENSMDARIAVKMSDERLHKIKARMFTLNTGLAKGSKINFKGRPGVVEFIESQTGAFARVGGGVYFFTFTDVATGDVQPA